QPPANGIFPVGRVESDLPDVVPARPGPPGRFSCGEALERLFQVGAVPGLFLEALIEHLQQEWDCRRKGPLSHRDSPCMEIIDDATHLSKHATDILTQAFQESTSKERGSPSPVARFLRVGC